MTSKEERLQKLKTSSNPEQLLYEWTKTGTFDLKMFKEAIKIIKNRDNRKSCDYCYDCSKYHANNNYKS